MYVLSNEEGAYSYFPPLTQKIKETLESHILKGGIEDRSDEYNPDFQLSFFSKALLDFMSPK